MSEFIIPSIDQLTSATAWYLVLVWIIWFITQKVWPFHVEHKLKKFEAEQKQLTDIALIRQHLEGLISQHAEWLSQDNKMYDGVKDSLSEMNILKELFVHNAKQIGDIKDVILLDTTLSNTSRIFRNGLLVDDNRNSDSGLVRQRKDLKDTNQ
jgi:hypothetical protein